MIFHKSIDESKVYKINLYRSVVKRIEEVSEFKHLLFASDADICKIKFSANEKDIYRALDSLNVPYQLYNINYANAVYLSDVPAEAMQWDEDHYSFESCTPENYDVLHELVTETIAEKTWSNFNSNIASDILKPELELEATAEYACSFIRREHGREVWLLKFDLEVIGFFMGQTEGDGFLGTLYGIGPDHRNAGHSRVIYKMMLHICHQRGYEFFKNEIGLLNLPSQKSAQSQRMTPTDISFHFELYPFLSTKGVASISIEEVMTCSIQEAIQREFPNSILDKKLRKHYLSTIVERQSNRSDVVLVIDRADYSLIVCRHYNFQNGELPCAIEYLEYSSS